MADDKEKKEGEEGGGKSKMLPILLGVILVVGGAVGVVAMTAPQKPKEAKKEIDLDSFPAKVWPEKLSWTFNPGTRRNVAKIGISFEYKAEDDLKTQGVILEALPKARSRIQILLLGKKVDELTGGDNALQLKLEMRDILNETFFPNAEDAHAKVSDVYFDEYLIK